MSKPRGRTPLRWPFRVRAARSDSAAGGWLGRSGTPRRAALDLHQLVPVLPAVDWGARVPGVGLLDGGHATGTWRGTSSLLVVGSDFNVLWSGIGPAEADPPLLVDPDAVPARAIARQRPGGAKSRSERDPRSGAILRHGPGKRRSGLGSMRPNRSQNAGQSPGPVSCAHFRAASR
jgi:hypothetical protein